MACRLRPNASVDHEIARQFAKNTASSAPATDGCSKSTSEDAEDGELCLERPRSQETLVEARN